MRRGWDLRCPAKDPPAVNYSRAERRAAGSEYGNTCVSSLDMNAAKRMPVHPPAGMAAMVALPRTIRAQAWGGPHDTAELDNRRASH